MYFAAINGVVEGPFKLDQLHDMNLPCATKISSVDAPDSWFELGVMGRPRAVHTRTDSLFSPPSSAYYDGVVQRETVRRTSAYPYLRQLTAGMLIALVLAILVSALCLFVYPLQAMLVICSSLGGVVTLAIFRIFLDIADCLLRKA